MLPACAAFGTDMRSACVSADLSGEGRSLSLGFPKHIGFGHSDSRSVRKTDNAHCVVNSAKTTGAGHFELNSAKQIDSSHCVGEIGFVIA